MSKTVLIVDDETNIVDEELSEINPYLPTSPSPYTPCRILREFLCQKPY